MPFTRLGARGLSVDWFSTTGFAGGSGNFLDSPKKKKNGESRTIDTKKMPMLNRVKKFSSAAIPAHSPCLANWRAIESRIMRPIKTAQVLARILNSLCIGPPNYPLKCELRSRHGAGDSTPNGPGCQL